MFTASGENGAWRHAELAAKITGMAGRGGGRVLDFSVSGDPLFGRSITLRVLTSRALHTFEFDVRSADGLGQAQALIHSPSLNVWRSDDVELVHDSEGR